MADRAPTYEELRASRMDAWGQVYDLKKTVKELKSERKRLETDLREAQVEAWRPT